MICVTGASGTLGSEVVRKLTRAMVPFRAAYFSTEKANAARERGLDAVTMDYNHPKSLRQALKGCERVFLLGPNVVNQTEIEVNAVEAAKDSGVRHIVKQSVMAAAEEGYSLATIHRAVERAIEASGLDWTFLRPNSFMQNVVTFMGQSIRAESAFFSATGSARISHVDVRDIAAVAVQALIEPGHSGKTYTLTGPEALSYDEMAAELSAVLKRTIRHVNLSDSEMRHGMVSGGLPEELADRLMDLERYFREGWASRVTNDIADITGSEPGRFSQYARDCAPLLSKS